MKKPAIIIGIILVGLCLFFQLSLQFGNFPGESSWGAAIILAYLYAGTIAYVIVISLFFLVKSLFSHKSDVTTLVKNVDSGDHTQALIGKLIGLAFFLFLAYLFLASVFCWHIPFVDAGICH